jgi:hypothetical protein
MCALFQSESCDITFSYVRTYVDGRIRAGPPLWLRLRSPPSCVVAALLPNRPSIGTLCVIPTTPTGPSQSHQPATKSVSAMGDHVYVHYTCTMMLLRGCPHTDTHTHTHTHTHAHHTSQWYIHVYVPLWPNSSLLKCGRLGSADEKQTPRRTTTEHNQHLNK